MQPGECTSPLRPNNNRFETYSTASFAGTTFSSSYLVDMKIERLNAAKISSSSSRRFEKPRDIRRGFHEAGFLRIGDKRLHRRTRNFARENNALPRVRDQLGGNVAARLSQQLGFHDFLCFLPILQNPVGEFPMCLPEFIRELALFIEKLHARFEYRRRAGGLLDPHLAAAFVVNPRHSCLNHPSRS